MSSIIKNPHDRFFRASMSNPRIALEFIHAHFPPHIVAAIDPASLQLMPGNFIEDLHEWKTDLVYKATFQGDPGYIHLLIEHQRKLDSLMPLRILEYSLKIIRADLKENKNGPLSLVYPCVLYNGTKPYSKTTDFFELFQHPDLARTIFLKPFNLIDLTQIADDDLKKQSLLGIVEMLLKHAFTRDIVAFIKSISELLQQVEQLKGFELLHESAQYLFHTNKDGISKYEVLNEFKKHVSPPTQKNIMTIAEAFVEEGRQEGLQTGRQEGRQEGVRKLLERQIERRFPSQITSNQLQLIEQADSEDLTLWGERLIDATFIAEIFI